MKILALIFGLMLAMIGSAKADYVCSPIPVIGVADRSIQGPSGVFYSLNGSGCATVANAGDIAWFGTQGFTDLTTIFVTTPASPPQGGISGLSGIIFGNGTNAATAITPGAGVAAALGQAVNSASGLLTSNGSPSLSGLWTFNRIVLGEQDVPSAIGGMSISSQFHADWNVTQSTLPFNPTEWQIYPNSTHGRAHCQSPGSSGVVVWDSGFPFDPTWVGRTGFYLPNQSNRSQGVYSVASYQSTTQITLSTNCVGSGVEPFFFTTTTNDGFVNVNGTTVSWASGQTFNAPTQGITNAWKINGTNYTCSSVDTLVATCNTSGNLTNVAYHTDFNNNDELSLLRVQTGQDYLAEISAALIARAVGEFDLQVQASQVGSFWPLYIMSGNYGSPSYAPYRQIGVQASGDLTLGGDYGYDIIRLTPGAQNTASNFLFSQMAPSGYAPGFAARANTADTSVGLAFDTFGTGTTSFTSHAYGNTEFQIFGVGGTSWLGVASNGGDAPALSAVGSGANININLLPKGTGVLQIGGVAGVSCAAGTLNLTTAVVTKGVLSHC